MSEPADVPFYPDCSSCGHNSSGVVAERCTAFVPYPEGDPRGMAGYCYCRCNEDPVIKAWLAERDSREAELAMRRLRQAEETADRVVEIYEADDEEAPEDRGEAALQLLAGMSGSQLAWMVLNLAQRIAEFS